MNISGLWDTLVDAICRPPRDKYQISELVGGRRGYCKLSGKTIVREDLVLVNKRGLKLQCSHYKPSGASPEQALPIVIYCHCNSGSRRDAEEAFYVLLPNDITVFCLDFAGSGMSDGDWVTLGAHEVDDLEVAVAHLRENFPHSTIGLWGRSMGAVTALLYSARDPSIAGVVMDSPFARLTELMVELVDEQKLPIPKPFMRVALGMMRRSVRKRAGFNIDSVAPLDSVRQCFIPALFGHATEDTFVNRTHSQRLHDAYAGSDKSFVTFEGDHNSVRPSEFYSSVFLFLHTALRCSASLTRASPGGSARKPQALPKAMSLDGEAFKDGLQGSTAIQADASSKEDNISPTQRTLAPPWNREQARTNTEQQLQVIRGLARTTSGMSASSPRGQPAGSGHCQGSSDDGTASNVTHWMDSEPPLLEPPESIERAPWLHADPAAAPSRLSAEHGPLQTMHQGAGTNMDSSVWPPATIQPTRSVPDSHCVLDESGSDATASPAMRTMAGNGWPDLGAPAPSHERDVSCMSIEDRFWHLQPCTEDSLASSEKDEALARALEQSMREAACQAQLHSTAATQHAGRETRLAELIPDAMRNISQEDAEELMLVEAIKASLLEAERNGLVDASPSSCEPVGHARRRGSGGASGSNGGRQKSRGLFWRRKDPQPPRALPAKGKAASTRT